MIDRSHLKQQLDSLFAIDLRSLAALRVGLGVILLVDLARRAELASTFLSSTGVLPYHPSETWGLYRLLGSHVGPEILLGTQALAAACLLVGFFTRVAGLTCLALLLALCARNPWILDGGDSVLQLLLIWSVLLPLGSRFSFDAKRKGLSTRSERILSPSAAGLRLQLGFVYVFSVLHKIKGEAWREGYAARDALSQTLWARPFGTWMVEHPSLCTVVNYSTLLIEFIAPLLLLLPRAPALGRKAAVLALILLQLGIGCSLRMGLFPWIMTLTLVPFIPGSFWERLSGQAGKSEGAGFGGQETSSKVDVHPLVQRAGAILLVIAVLSSFKNLTSRISVPPAVEKLEQALGLTQSWSMYSPTPSALDFGMSVAVKLSDGTQLDLDDGHGGRRWEPLEEIWSDYRGGMYMENISNDGWPDEHAAFAQWIRREWETGDPRNRKVTEITLNRREWRPSRPGSSTAIRLYQWWR